MSTTKQSVIVTLENVIENFNNIKTAIENMGVTVGDSPKSEYPALIESITTGDTDVDELQSQIETLQAQVDSLEAENTTNDTYFGDIYDAIVSKGQTPTESDRSTYALAILAIETGGSNSGDGVDITQYINTTPTSLYNAFGGNDSTPSDVLLPKIVELLNTSSVTTMRYCFTDLTNVTTLDLSHWSFTNCTTEQNMFSGCSNLQTLVLPENTPVKNAGSMFYGCTSLVSIGGSINLSDCSGISSMFSNCSSLVNLIISDFSYNSNQTLDLSACAVLNAEALINGLPEYTGTRTKTIKLNSAVYTDALVTLGSAKGYTITS